MTELLHALHTDRSFCSYDSGVDSLALHPVPLGPGIHRGAHVRKKILILFITGAVLALGGALALRVPEVRDKAKEYWHIWKRPPLPDPVLELNVPDYAEGATILPDVFDPDPKGRAQYSPNLRWRATNAPYKLTETTSPMIARRCGDVSEKLVAFSMGVRMKCAAEQLDFWITMRIDRPDGSNLEWHERGLWPSQHVPNEWVLFRSEWLIRDLPVSADDRLIVFIRNPNRAEVLIDEIDVVFTSAHPLPPRPHHE